MFIEITSLRLPCPFLENDRCMVYEARPLVCRTYVVESNPQECATNPFRNVSESSNRVLLKHFGTFMRLEFVARQRPLVYAVAETLGVMTFQKPIIMGVSLMTRRFGVKQ